MNVVHNFFQIMNPERYLFISEPPLQAHLSPINNTGLLCIRIYSLVHLTAVFIYDFTTLKSLLSKFTYLTNFSYFFSWLYFAIIVQDRFIAKAKGLAQYAEIIFEAVYCLQWLVTLVYWSLMRDDEYNPQDLFFSVNAHGVVLVLLSLDLVFNSFRFCYTQYFGFIGICGVYLLLFNLPYALTVKAVYGRALNWISWQTYVFIVIGLFGSALVFFVCRQIYVKCKSPKIQNKQETTAENTQIILNNNSAPPNNAQIIPIAAKNQAQITEQNVRQAR